MNIDQYNKVVKDFIKESNRIEGIIRSPKKSEIAEFERFISLPHISIEELDHFIAVYQPVAHRLYTNRLRDKEGLNVRVGEYRPPEGGKFIRTRLEELLAQILTLTPYRFHILYEQLHPYLDGNGRSGRMLWVWHMKNSGSYDFLEIGFLRWFYYQTLKNSTTGIS